MDDIKIEPIIFKEKNLWDLKIKNNYIFINDIEELIKLIKENKFTNFEVKNNYVPGNKTVNNRCRNFRKKRYC